MNTSTVIVIIILILILIPAVKGGITHLKGEGSCCGGPKEKPVRKKIKGKPIESLYIEIEGMHCSNCKNRIEKNLDALDGVVANVSLSKKAATVKLYKDIDHSLITSIIEDLDFKVLNLKVL